METYTIGFGQLEFRCFGNNVYKRFGVVALFWSIIFSLKKMLVRENDKSKSLISTILELNTSIWKLNDTFFFLTFTVNFNMNLMSEFYYEYEKKVHCLSCSEKLLVK